MNRLKINIANKIDIINGAIDLCERLINNETIELHGLHNLNLTKGNTLNKDLLNRIEELKKERNNLSVIFSRFH